MDNLNKNSNYGVIDESNLNEPVVKNKHTARMIFVTLLVLIAFVGGYFLLTNENVKTQLQQVTGAITPIPQEMVSKQDAPVPTSVIQNRSLPWVELKVNDTPLKVGQTFNVVMNGYAGEKDIVGYDILLSIDPLVWEVVDVKSEIPDFIIEYFDKERYVSITGIKDIRNQAPLILNGTPFLSVVLKPKISGALPVSVLRQQGPETTKFVDNNVEVIVPQIGSVTVNVEP
jgi:hypothetical protein